MKHIFLFLLILLTLDAIAIKPDREYKWTPVTRGLAYDEYQLETPDHYMLNVWEYPRPDSLTSNKTMVLVGTDAGNMSYLIWQAKAFVSKGFRVIAFDYRGFGKSSDFTINSNFLFYYEFSIDLDTVIRAARGKYPNDKIGLYSLSMGTYVSLLRKEKVDFLVAEGFYANPQKVVDRIKTNKNATVLLPLGSSPINVLKEKTPTLIFCASNDNITTTGDAKEFANKNNAQIIEFNGDHLGGMTAFTRQEFGDEYTDKILMFLDKNGV